MPEDLTTPPWEDVPQARTDFGVRISILPFRRSAPHLHITLSGPQMAELAWQAGKSIIALQILRDHLGQPTKARLRAVAGTEDFGRLLWKSGGAKHAGCGRLSFRLPDDMGAARLASHEPDFQVRLYVGQTNTLTIDLALAGRDT